MSTQVRDVMNSKLVYLRSGDRPEITLRTILKFGITAVPVLDDLGRPVGVVSLRDIVDSEKRGARISENVVTVGPDDSLEDAARILAEANVHHLVVIDASRRAIGMISALDMVRAFIGLEPKHPEAITSFKGAEIKVDPMTGQPT